MKSKYTKAERRNLYKDVLNKITIHSYFFCPYFKCDLEELDELIIFRPDDYYGIAWYNQSNCPELIKNFDRNEFLIIRQVVLEFCIEMTKPDSHD